MIYYAWSATLLSLGLAWYFFGWQLAVVLIVFDLAITLHYITLKVNMTAHKLQKGMPIEEVEKYF